MNRPTRQVMATLVLLALTVAPTIGIAVIAWRINRPQHVREVEADLGRQLGLRATLDAVRYPRPGEVVYRGVVLYPGEGRGGVAREIARADEAGIQKSDRELTLRLQRPRLAFESPAAAMAHLESLMQLAGRIAFDRIGLTAPSCELDLGREDLRYTARDLGGEFHADPAMPTLKLAYRMPTAHGPHQARGLGVSAGTHCELTLTRDRRTDPLTTTLTLRTVEGLPLPVRVLNPFFDSPDWLGPNATVEGTLHLRREGSRDWEAEFSGSLHEIDLTRLVGRRFPRHRLTGRGRLLIASARWGPRPGRGPGWIEARGEILAGPGSIGLSLLRSLAIEMRFRLSPRLARLDPRTTETEFHAMGLSFDMRPDGEIRLAGALGDGSPPDVVLTGMMGPMAAAPPETSSVHGLIKTLFPIADATPGTLVPLTPESSVLLSLPVPPSKDPKVRRASAGNE